MENFEINFKQIDQIKKITLEEKNFRIKNLELFNTAGFPSKKFEDWKFTDFRKIVDNNFNKLDTKKITSDFKKTELLKNFDHNYIILVNGSLHSYNFDHEEKSKIKISSYDNNINYELTENPLICLNHALAENGYSLEVEENYKFNKNVNPLNISFTVLSGTNDQSTSKSGVLGWKDLSLKSCEFNTINGNHFFVHNKIEDVMNIINKTLL